MKKGLLCLAIFLLTMVVCPVGLTLLSHSDAWNAIGWLFILNFALYPITFIALGIISGTEIKKLWYVPVGAAVLYLPALWLTLQSIMIEFAVYAAIYFAIGVVAMLITHGVIGAKRKWIKS